MIVAGAVWSAVRLARRRSTRRLAFANALIAVGTVILGAGGILNSVLNEMDGFAVSLVAGITVIFAGFLLTNAPQARHDARRGSRLMRVEIEPGVRLYFDSEGAGLEPDGPTMREKPVLLLLHGGPGFDHSLFKPWFGRFADTHQVVYLDHRGQGRSDQRKDSTNWLLDTWADDVAVLRGARDREAGRARQLVRRDGRIHMAARHPDLASKLILSSTAARMVLDDVFAMFQKLGGDDIRAIAETFWTAPDDEIRAQYMTHCLPLYTQHSGNLTEGSQRPHEHAVGDFFILGEQDDGSRDDLATIRSDAGLAGELIPCVRRQPGEIVGLIRRSPRVVRRLRHGTYRDQPERTEVLARSWSKRFLAEGAAEDLAAEARW